VFDFCGIIRRTTSLLSDFAHFLTLPQLFAGHFAFRPFLLFRNVRFREGNLTEAAELSSFFAPKIDRNLNENEEIRMKKHFSKYSKPSLSVR
jgi:hypothetical protein